MDELGAMAGLLRGESPMSGSSRPRWVSCLGVFTAMNGMEHGEHKEQGQENPPVLS